MNDQLWIAPKPGTNARGKVETVVYFEDAHRHIVIACSTNQPTPHGYMRCEATTVHEVKSLSQRMAEQQMRKFGAMDKADMQRREAFFAGCIARARKTITNPLTSQKEREFLERKLIPQWEAEVKLGKVFREFYFRQEAYEATHTSED